MLDLDLSKLTDDRKHRLFAVACVREVWHLLIDEKSRNAVEVAELFADGLVSREELTACDAAWLAAWAIANSDLVQRGANAAGWGAAWAIAGADVRKETTNPKECNAGNAAECTARAFAQGAVNDSTWDVAARYSEISAQSIAAIYFANSAYYSAWANALEKQQLFLNDIGDKPDIQISPISLAWNNQTLTKLATEIYNSKNFDNMPILADALQDANALTEFVEHCYNPVHVKGCWLLDILRQN